MKFVRDSERFIMDIPKWQIQSFLDELASRIWQAVDNRWMMLREYSETRMVELDEFVVYITINVKKR